MTKSEYLEAYPFRKELFENYHYKNVPDSGRKNGHKRKFVYMKCEDPNCLTPDKVYEVNLGFLTLDKCGDGLYRCRHCGHVIALERRKQRDDYNEQLMKFINSSHTVEARKKWYKTITASGYARSRLELEIDREFGSFHGNVDRFYNGHYLEKECDCLFPNGKGIEVDGLGHKEVVSTPGKYERRQGFHRRKDDYFRSIGVEVLHITMNMPDWKTRVEQFLNGTYNGPLIDLDDPTYGDIIYEAIV